jgi:hypothetical protein
VRRRLGRHLQDCIARLAALPLATLAELEAELRRCAEEAEVVSGCIGESEPLTMLSLDVVNEIGRQLEVASRTWDLSPVERSRRLRDLRQSLLPPCLALMARAELESSTDSRRRSAYSHLLTPVAAHVPQFLT